MEIRKLTGKSLNKTQFAQMVEIEQNCGLEPYPPEVLLECIIFLDTFACFQGNRLVGFVTMNPHGRYFGGSLYVVNINVARAFRHRGIAKQLLYAVYLYYVEGYENTPVSLDVTETNRAMERYREIGFRVSNLPSRNGDTDVVMSMLLKEMGRNLERLLEGKQ